MKPKRNTKRVQLDMTPPDIDLLDRVKEAIEASSRAEAVRRTLAFYQAIIGRMAMGEKLFIGRNKEEAQEVILI